MKHKFLAGLVLGITIIGSIAAKNRIEQLQFTSDADANGFQITGLGSPTNSSNAATVGYVANQLSNYTPAIQFTNAPATNSAGTPGALIQSGNHLYLCTGTNTWRRIELLTW